MVVVVVVVLVVVIPRCRLCEEDERFHWHHQGIRHKEVQVHDELDAAELVHTFREIPLREVQ